MHRVLTPYNGRERTAAECVRFDMWKSGTNNNLRSMMPGRRITIEVPDETAEAYQQASPERRRRAERAFSWALLSRDGIAAAFEEVTGRMADYAEQQGLTPEKLDELLNEEET